jgi:hypothetical protein
MEMEIGNQHDNSTEVIDAKMFRVVKPDQSSCPESLAGWIHCYHVIGIPSGCQLAQP